MDNCRFCNISIDKECPKRNSLTAQLLEYNYLNEFYFYFSKPINEILVDARTEDNIRFRNSCEMKKSKIQILSYRGDFLKHKIKNILNEKGKKSFKVKEFMHHDSWKIFEERSYYNRKMLRNNKSSVKNREFIAKFPLRNSNILLGLEHHGKNRSFCTQVYDIYNPEFSSMMEEENQKKSEKELKENRKKAKDGYFLIKSSKKEKKHVSISKLSSMLNSCVKRSSTYRDISLMSKISNLSLKREESFRRKNAFFDQETIKADLKPNVSESPNFKKKKKIRDPIATEREPIMIDYELKNFDEVLDELDEFALPQKELSKSVHKEHKIFSDIKNPLLFKSTDYKGMMMDVVETKPTSKKNKKIGKKKSKKNLLMGNKMKNKKLKDKYVLKPEIKGRNLKEKSEEFYLRDFSIESMKRKSSILSKYSSSKKRKKRKKRKKISKSSKKNKNNFIKIEDRLSLKLSRSPLKKKKAKKLSWGNFNFPLNSNRERPKILKTEGKDNLKKNHSTRRQKKNFIKNKTILSARAREENLTSFKSFIHTWKWKNNNCPKNQKINQKKILKEKEKMREFLLKKWMKSSKILKKIYSPKGKTAKSCRRKRNHSLKLDEKILMKKFNKKFLDFEKEQSKMKEIMSFSKKLSLFRSKTPQSEKLTKKKILNQHEKSSMKKALFIDTNHKIFRTAAPKKPMMSCKTIKSTKHRKKKKKKINFKNLKVNEKLFSRKVNFKFFKTKKVSLSAKEKSESLNKHNSIDETKESSFKGKDRMWNLKDYIIQELNSTSKKHRSKVHGMENEIEDNHFENNEGLNEDIDGDKNGDEHKNNENEILKKYKLLDVKIERKITFNDEIFKENVTKKWFTKESFLKTMKKKNYF